jgi:hypothetical protein
MKKKYFKYRGKYSGTYRIASAEDVQTVSALLSEGWTRTTLAEVRPLRKCGAVAGNTATAYIYASGALVIVDPD